MKNPLSFFFKRATTRQALLENAAAQSEMPEDVPDAVAEFQTAKFGTACTTHAFLTVQNHIEWLTAQQGRNSRWSIRKVTEMPNITGRAVPVGEAVQKTMTLQSGLSFFDAMKVLATYEHGQMALQAVPVDLDRPSLQSGQDHYAAFAEREGIVFDTSGDPYPTINGDVVGDGVFTKDALERARAVYRKQSALYLQGNDFLGTLFHPIANTRDSFDQTICAAVNVTYLQEIITRLQAIGNLIEASLFTAEIVDRFPGDIMQMNSDDLVEYLGDDPARNGLIHYVRMFLKPFGQTIPQAVAERVSQIHAILPNIAIDGVDATYIGANVDAIAFYFEVGAIRSPTLAKFHSPERLRHSYQRLADSTHALEEKFLGLGGDDGDIWKIKSALLENEPDLAKPKVIDDFITGLTQLRDHIDHTKKKTASMVVAGPHRPRPPIVPM